MIVGLGVDITEVDRIEAAIARHGRAFLERLFTPSEIALLRKASQPRRTFRRAVSPPRKPR